MAPLNNYILNMKKFLIILPLVSIIGICGFGYKAMGFFEKSKDIVMTNAEIDDVVAKFVPEELPSVVVLPSGEEMTSQEFVEEKSVLAAEVQKAIETPEKSTLSQDEKQNWEQLLMVEMERCLPKIGDQYLFAGEITVENLNNLVKNGC